MAHDDEAHDPTSLEPESADQNGSGSNASHAADGAHDEIHDDDALADALAAEYTWLATAAIPIPSFDDYFDDTDDDGGDDPAGNVASDDAPAAPAAEALWVDSDPVGAPEPSSSTGEPPVAAPFVSPFDPPAPVAGAPDPATAPWSIFPAPDPTEAVDLPDGPPQFLVAAPVERWPAPSFAEPAHAALTDPVDDNAVQPASVPEIISTVPSWDPASREPASRDEVGPPESEPEPEEFPWIAAAAAAAAAPPLVAPVESDPFNWSITATGKVSYLDEPQADATPASTEASETSRPELDQEQVATAPMGAQQQALEPDPQPRFLPPALVEPTAAPQADPASAELRAAPPTYLPVDHREPEDAVAPLPPLFGAPASSTAGSVDVVRPAYDIELDDDVDDTDRFFASILTGTGAGPVAASAQRAVTPPSGPISTVRIADDEPVFFDDGPTNPAVFSVESTALEPTAVEQRAGHAIRLFWLWFSANSSIISVALGASVFVAGMSLRQSVVAILGGVALSLFPLALTSLAGKRSAQPTMVVSRATFGLLGNVVPAVLALISRIFWGGVLLWLLAVSVAAVLVTSGVALDAQPLSLVILAVAWLIALAIAFAGYPLLARIQLLLTIISAVLIVGLIALTVQYVDIPRALTVGDGSWLLAVGGAVLVFSFVGLVWAFSGADLARYQRPASSGASSMLAAGFGTAVPAFVLIGYGAVLAASDPQIAGGLAAQPIQTLAGLLPAWYPVPLVAAVTLSLLSGVVITLYSGAFAVLSVGLRLSRPLSVVVVGIVLAGVAVLLTLTVTDGLAEVFRDLATTLAVPTAAWIGIFGSEMMIRNRRFESDSLLRRGGVYADARWVNLVGLVAITVVGFALTTATVSWLSWQGFGFTLLGVDLGSDLASTDLGVLVALVLGLLLPLVAGVPAIRRQEATRA